MSEILKFCYFFFIFVSFICGSVLEWYYKIAWYDLFVHFLSGIASTIFGAVILYRKSNLIQKNIFITVLFLLCFSLAIASFWEFFEFLCDQIFHKDAQFVQKTGVVDTMTDMLIAFFGSILANGYFLFEMKYRKKHIQKIMDNVL